MIARSVRQYVQWLAVACSLSALTGCCGAGACALRSGIPGCSPFRRPAISSTVGATALKSDLQPVAQGFARPASSEVAQVSADSAAGKTSDASITAAAWRSNDASDSQVGSASLATLDIPEAIPPPETTGRHDLSLHEAIDIALTQNPDVVTARAAAPVAYAARGVAATYPWNPQFKWLFPYARDAPETCWR